MTSSSRAIRYQSQKIVKFVKFRHPIFWHYPRHSTMSQSCAISSRRPKCVNLTQVGTNAYGTDRLMLSNLPTHVIFLRMNRIIRYPSSSYVEITVLQAKLDVFSSLWVFSRNSSLPRWKQICLNINLSFWPPAKIISAIFLHVRFMWEVLINIFRRKKWVLWNTPKT